MEKHSRILLDTFKSLIEYLEQNNYNWFVAYGTLLGTVRHKGMIPWDDDIDIFMPREDFDRFISEREIIRKESKYAVIAPGDENYYLSFAKYYDTHTTIWEMNHYHVTFGVYVDVFCLDYFCGSKQDFLKLIHKHQKLWNSYSNSLIHYSLSYLKWVIKGKHIKTLLLLPKNYISSLFTDTKSVKEKYFDFLERAKCEDYKTSNYCAWLQQDIVYKSEWFRKYKMMRFEDIEVRVPIGYHDFLKERYGNYMTPPPEDKRIPNASHTSYYTNFDESLSITEIEKVLKPD